MRIQISPPRMSLVALHLSSYTQCRDRHFLVSCSSIAERSIAQISLPPRTYARFRVELWQILLRELLAVDAKRRLL
jgi:hypothetical protein